MSILSPTAMYMYAAAAGFTASEAQIMQYIGTVESAGDTNAVNPSSGNTGIWQIGPKGTINDAGVGLTQAQLKNPVTNANAARTLFNNDKKRGGDGYSPWNASRSKWGSMGPNAADQILNPIGSAGAYVLGAPGNAADTAAAAAEKLIGYGKTALDLPGQVKRIADQFSKGGAWIGSPHNWLRVGYVMGGALLVIVGLEMVVHTKVMEKVGPALGGQVKTVRAASAAKKAAPAQAAAKASEARDKVNDEYNKTRAREQAKADVKSDAKES